MRSPELLVIGAGPYGLAVSAHAQRHGIDTVTVGAPMGFWREHMPAGMSLRSGPDWHLDVAGENTFEAFLAEKGITASDVHPIPISVYLDYTDWFIAAEGTAHRRRPRRATGACRRPVRGRPGRRRTDPG